MTVLEQIYEALVAEGMGHTGALAMIGNMDGESCLYSNNLQDSYNRAFGLTDAEYTERVNAGRATTKTGKHFEDDGAGYGLCQWTYAPRKKGLYKVAREQWGVSVDDVSMQCWYACYELRTDYSGLWAYLRTDDIDLYNAVSRVCKEFERPAVNNIDHRYKCAQRRAAELTELKKHQTRAPAAGSGGDPKIAILQALMCLDGYWLADQLDGIRSAEFKNALTEYAADVKKI